MARLGILLTLGPFQFENWETVADIADAAIDKGHQVDFFYFLDGVYNPVKHQAFPDLEVLPKDRVARLVERGAHITACGVCVNARGLQGGQEFVPGVKVGGLPDFAEIVGEADRIITF